MYSVQTTALGHVGHVQMRQNRKEATVRAGKILYRAKERTKRRKDARKNEEGKNAPADILALALAFLLSARLALYGAGGAVLLCCDLQSHSVAGSGGE